MLDSLPTGPESIELRNFLAIRSGRVKLASFTAFIGPQAAGKSIIAKVAFFGRTYIEEFLSSVYLQDHQSPVSVSS